MSDRVFCLLFFYEELYQIIQSYWDYGFGLFLSCSVLLTSGYRKYLSLRFWKWFYNRLSFVRVWVYV